MTKLICIPQTTGRIHETKVYAHIVQNNNSSTPITCLRYPASPTWLHY